MANLNKLKKYHFLYKTTNLLNGTFYIGIHSTNNLNDGYLGSGKRLRRSIKKYGTENFKLEILEFFENRELLVEKEKELVNTDLLQNNNCMNLRPGGEGGFISINGCKKGRLEADKILENKYGYDFRRIISKNYYDNITKENRLILNQKIKNGLKRVDFNSATRLGVVLSKETKQKISKAKKGKGTGKANSQFGTMWITNGTESKKIKKEEIIPTGWKVGRVINKVKKHLEI